MEDKDKEELDEEVKKAIQGLIDSFDFKKYLIEWLMDEWEYQEKYAGAFIPIKPKKEDE